MKKIMIFFALSMVAAMPYAFSKDNEAEIKSLCSTVQEQLHQAMYLAQEVSMDVDHYDLIFLQKEQREKIRNLLGKEKYEQVDGLYIEDKTEETLKYNPYYYARLVSTYFLYLKERIERECNQGNIQNIAKTLYFASYEINTFLLDMGAISKNDKNDLKRPNNAYMKTEEIQALIKNNQEKLDNLKWLLKKQTESDDSEWSDQSDIQSLCSTVQQQLQQVMDLAQWVEVAVGRDDLIFLQKEQKERIRTLIGKEKYDKHMGTSFDYQLLITLYFSYLKEQIERACKQSTTQNIAKTLYFASYEINTFLLDMGVIRQRYPKEPHHAHIDAEDVKNLTAYNQKKLMVLKGYQKLPSKDDDSR
jgi:hypothetical protein